MQEKTMKMRMNRVLCAVLTLMLMLALVPSYAFAAESPANEPNPNTSIEKYVPSDTRIHESHGGYRFEMDYELCMIEIHARYYCPTCDILFVTGGSIGTIGENSHDFSDWEVTVEPTTTTPGEEASICAKCGVYEMTREIPVLEEDTSNISNITIETEASSINVTVPTNAAFVFKGDGTNIYPSNYEVTNNNALTAITLNSIDFEGVNDWSLTTEDDTFQADVKKFALKMGLKDGDLSVVDKANGVSFSGDTEIKIAPNGSKTLGFEAKRGVFSSPVTTENAMQMTMHFDWERL